MRRGAGVAERPAGTAGRTFAAAFACIILAFLVGRLLFHGGWAWVLFGALLPIILLVTALLLGFVRAILFVGIFAGGALAIGMLARDNPMGWIVLLLMPALAFALALCVKVVLQLLRQRGRLASEAAAGNGEPEAPDRA